ncbi:MAG: DMT family transporter, partial [Pseudomonadota bacterium]
MTAGATAQAAEGDRPGRAAGLLVGALMVLSVQDTVAKSLVEDVSLWQFQVVRSAINAVLLLGVGALIVGGLPRRPIRLWAVVLRTVMINAVMVLFFAGLPYLTLAEIAAGLHCFPVFVTLIALVLPGERVGWRRILAVGIGITGALMVLKPGGEGFSAVSLLPIGAGMAYAGFVVVTRRLCRHEHPATLALAITIGLTVLGTTGLAVMSLLPMPGAAASWPYLFTGWHPLSGPVLGLIATCAVLNLSAQLVMAVAYQTAESSYLAPFDYSYLVFVTLIGGVVFGEWPD